MQIIFTDTFLWIQGSTDSSTDGHQGDVFEHDQHMFGHGSQAFEIYTVVGIKFMSVNLSFL